MPITAADFTTAMLAAGGDELQEFWLAQDGSQWVVYDSGSSVSQLNGQKTIVQSAGTSGTFCPTLIPGGAPGGRDALRFTQAAGSRLLTGAHFNVANGERWGICFLGRMNTSPPVALAHVMQLVQGASAGAALALEFETVPELRWRVHYDDGGAGDDDAASVAYSTNNPLAFGVFATSPHTRYLNGIETAMAESAGVFDVGAGAQRVAFGRGGFGDVTGPGDFDLWCAMLFKMSGAGMPSGFAAMMSFAASYYETSALNGAGEPYTTTRSSRTLIYVPQSETVVEQPCHKEYATFVYGTGVTYGSSTCPPAGELYLSVDTPARDLIQVITSVEFVVNPEYFNPDNYVIIDVDSGKQLQVRKVLKPFNNVVSSRILLFLDKHVAGREYQITVKNLIQRNGSILDPTSGLFIARDAKANSMLAALPDHFNADPKTSVLRQVLQAMSESDDKIGSLR